MYFTTVLLFMLTVAFYAWTHCDVWDHGSLPQYSLLGLVGNTDDHDNNDFNNHRVAVTFPYEKPYDAHTAVFYHIFIPETVEGKQNSLRIVREQLQQLRDSQTAITVYFNTIGTNPSNDLNANVISQVCTELNMPCHAMEHYEQGMEDKTLQKLHDYCTLHPDDGDHQVAYIHNKGSYSTKALNEAWRYQMTQAVSSSQCLQATASSNHNDQCNLCGLFFSAERGLFMAGNMWTSHCSYIRQLKPLDQFTQAMHDVTAEALMERLRYKLVMTTQEIRAGVFGIDRYATEFWVGSHPTLQPCDFSKAVPVIPNKFDLTDMFLSWLRQMGGNYQQPLQPHWFVEKAPHLQLRLNEKTDVSKFKDVRLREYFLMAGNLFKWFYLYGQAPPLDSWVYQWFPDGQLWQNAVRQHGNHSVDIITTEALKTEAKSQRNKYTADRSVALTNKKKAAGGAGAGTGK